MVTTVWLLTMLAAVLEVTRTLGPILQILGRLQEKISSLHLLVRTMYLLRIVTVVRF